MSEGGRPVRFRAGVQAFAISPQGVALTDGRQGEYIVDSNLVRLLPYLEQGYPSEEELAHHLASRQTAAATLRTLHRLRRQGWLEERPLPGPPSLQAFWSGVATQVPTPTTVSWRFLNGVDPGWAGAWKTRLDGHPWLSAVDEGELEVVVTADYRHPDILKYARDRGGRHWMPLAWGGSELWLGPLLGDSHSPNVAALLADIGRNRPFGTWLAHSTPHAFELNPAWTPSAAGLALQLVVLELERALCHPQFSTRHLLVYDAHTARLTPHLLAFTTQPIGQGTGLGQSSPPSVPTKGPVSLRPIPKPHPCSDRLLGETEVWNQLAGLVEERVGLVIGTEELESHRVPLSNQFAYSVVTADPAYDIDSSVRRTNSGCSTRPAGALMKAVAEAVERYSGCFQEKDPTLLASFQDLGDRAIHPNQVLLYSEAQYEDPCQSARAFDGVCDPLDPGLPILWTPLWSLTRGETRYLPTSQLFYAAGTLFDDPGAPFCLVDSNGCATGGCLEEAILHGLFELIQRDAVAVWWFNRLTRPALDLGQFGPEVSSLASYFEAHGENLWVLDLTHDLGVPVAAAVTVRRNGRQDPAFGFACNLDMSKAILGALVEAAQWASAYGLRSRRGNSPWVDFRLDASTAQTAAQRDALEWIEGHNTDTDPYILPAPGALHGPGQMPPWEPAPTFLEEIDRLRTRLEDKGLEMLVLDQSRPECHLQAARVVVPGLRMFWRRLAPGRLYQVPVELGWLPAPLTEEEMNPFSVFL